MIWLLLTFAAWRTWLFVADDELTDGLRARLPDRVERWVECERCSGFWIAGAWVGVYGAFYWPGWVVGAAAWWAAAAGVVLLEDLHHRLTE